MNHVCLIVVSATLGLCSLAHAQMNCGAEYQTTGEFEKGKNSPKIYPIPALKLNTLTKIDGKERGVRVFHKANRFEITLVDGTDSILGTSVLDGLSRKIDTFELSINVPVQSESETLKVRCNPKK